MLAPEKKEARSLFAFLQSPNFGATVLRSVAMDFASVHVSSWPWQSRRQKRAQALGSALLLQAQGLEWRWCSAYR